jgi:hypothetical protein
MKESLQLHLISQHPPGAFLAAHSFRSLLMSASLGVKKLGNSKENRIAPFVNLC